MEYFQHKKAKMKALFEKVASQVQKNPRSAAAGAAIGAGFGLVTANEGRGPLSGGLVYGLAGTGLGIAFAGMRPDLMKAWQHGTEVARFARRPSAEWASTNPYMKDVESLSRGIGTAPLSHTSRAPQRSKAALLEGFYSSLKTQHRDALQAAYPSVTDMSAMKLQAGIMSGANIAVPESTRLAVQHAATEAGVAPGSLKSWGDIFQAVEGGDRDFLESLSGKMGNYARLNVQGLATAEDLGMSITAPVSDKMLGRGEAISRLRAQGRGDLATMIENLPSGVGVGGVEMGASGRVDELKFLLGGGEDISVPVVGKHGVFRRGMPGGKNVYVARRLADMALAQEALDAGSLAANAPKFLHLDEFVAKSITDYYKGVSQAGQMGAFGSFLRETITSSSAWEYNQYRMDRNELRPFARNVSMRARQVMFRMPGTTALAQAMGFAKGLDDATTMTNLQGWMKAHGRVQAGSETAARGLIYEDMAELGRLSYGSWKSPLEKSQHLLREWNKHYSTTVPSNMAAQYQGLPVATSKFRREIGAGSHLQFNLQGVFESELDFFRRATPQQLERLMSGAGITGGMADVTARTLRTMRDINEGIFAAAVPEEAMMTSARTVVVDQLNTALGSNLVGQKILPGTALGRDQFADKLVGHTFMDANKGFAEITGVEAFKDPMRGGASRIMLRLKESFPAATAKFGTAALKGYNTPISAAGVEGVQRLINAMRQDKAFSKLYGNNAILPMMTVGQTDGAVSGFALWSSMRKTQDMHQIMLSNLMTRHMKGMTAAGRTKVIDKLAAHSVTVAQTKSGNWEATIRTKNRRTAGLTKQYAGLDSAVKEIFQGIYRTPEQYFGGRAGGLHWANRVRQSNQELMGPLGVTRGGVLGRSIARMNWNQLQALEVGLHGITTAGVAWDTLQSNIPKQAGITVHELNILQRFGLGQTRNELLGRRRMRGTAKATLGFSELNSAFTGTIGDLGDKAIEAAGATRLTLDDVTAIHRMDIARGQHNLDLPPWRTLKRFKQNIVLDLITADGLKRDAARRVKEAMGGGQIIIPSTASDLFGVGFTTPEGRFIEEGFGKPLERMLRNVMRFYESGDEEALSRAVAQKGQYFAAISDRMNDLATGRGSATPDAGAWSAGRAIFKDYRQRFGKDIGEDMAGRVIGVTGGEYRRMMNKGAHTVTLGGHEFMVGVSKRFPITAAGPALIYHDRTIREGMALDEMNRILSRMDFDGDTVYAHAMMNKASVAELVGAMRDPNSIANHNLREFERQGRLFGGIAEDIRLKGQLGMFDENVMQMFSDRAKKMVPMADQSLTSAMAKAATQHIGQYSNLSKQLDFMTMAPTQNLGERIMRQHLSEALQQSSIDFAREADRLGKSDPLAIAGLIRQSMNLAERGHTSKANEMLGSVFDDLGVTKGLMESAQAGGASADDIAMLNRLTGSFFTGVDPAEMRKRYGMAQAMLKKGLRGDDLESQMADYIATSQIRAAAGAEGDLPYAGSRAAGGQISAWNRFQKGRKAGQHILKDVWSRFKGTPHARAAGTLLGAAGVTAAGIGLMSSPSPMRPPTASNNAMQATMRTPDTAMVGVTGEAPIPGGRHGNVASRKGPQYSARNGGGVTLNERRMYYDQTNRVPNLTMYDTVPEGDAIAAASEFESSMRRSMGSGRVNVNIAHSPSARRFTRIEMEDKFREEMTRS